MKIPYLIIICTVLLVSGAINVGSTDITGTSGEKQSITDLRKGIGWQIDNGTTHRQVRLHRTVKSDAAHQASKNSHTSMEFEDKGRAVQLPRLHVSRVQVTILSLCLLSLKPVGHA
ncbi:MAG: hypothetical protein ABIU05_23700 [Nitrospirales bacterium]